MQYSSTSLALFNIDAGQPIFIGVNVKDEFQPKNGYRMTVAKVHASAFGIPQDQIWYCCFWHQHCFNVSPPKLPESIPTTFDGIWDVRDRETQPVPPTTDQFDEDCFYDLTAEDWWDCEWIPPGYSREDAGKHWLFHLCKYSKLDAALKRVWWCQMPPRMHPGAARYLHPTIQRPLTLGEISRLKGFDGWLPEGKSPVFRLGQFVPPPILDWMMVTLDKQYDKEWFSDFNANTGKFVGSVFDEPPERKDYDLSAWKPYDLNFKRFPAEVFDHYDRERVSQVDGSIWNPWQDTKGM